jgi:23S rRNA pseudouridine1911/1915/1917 synthase
VVSEGSRLVELAVPAAQDGERLDRALAAAWPGLGVATASRATLQRWIRDGRVRVDGAVREDPSQSVRAGQRVEVRPAPPPPSSALPEDLPLVVLHEDDELVVVDKAAGMVVHPAAGHATGTLVNALLHRFGALAPESGRPADDDDEDESTAGPRRPGIVHRLDRWTSGVMVVARTDRARDLLMAQLAAHAVDRAYLAFVEGSPPSRTRFETLHGRHPTDRKRFSTKVARGKRAVTTVEVVERFAGAAMVRCTLETGRTHQIRVHLSEAGFPLLGDAVYGRPARRLAPGVEAAVRDHLEAGRQALHAALLGFDHPGTGQRVRFESPLPADLARLLESLRALGR